MSRSPVHMRRDMMRDVLAYKSLYLYAMENGVFPAEDAMKPGRSSCKKDPIEDIRPIESVPNNIVTRPPYPMFRTDDDFDFPPNSPERKRLEEVREKIIKNWKKYEFRAQLRKRFHSFVYRQ